MYLVFKIWVLKVEIDFYFIDILVRKYKRKWREEKLGFIVFFILFLDFKSKF